MAAPRASIAVSVTRAGLTLATAFALTRVFAGRSWLFVMVLAAVVPPRAPRLGAAPPLAPARPARRGRGRRACGSRRSSPIPSTHGRGHPDARDRSRRSGTRSAARRTRCAPRSFRSRRSASALVLAFVGVFVAAALTDWIATVARRADRRVRARASRCSSSSPRSGSGGWVAPTALYALAVARLPARARRSTTSSTRRTWFHADRAARLAARRGRRAHRRGRGRGRAGRRPVGAGRGRQPAARLPPLGAAAARATCSRRHRRSSASGQAHARPGRRSCSP